jgi:hypothetical protein
LSVCLFIQTYFHTSHSGAYHRNGKSHIHYTTSGIYSLIQLTAVWNNATSHNPPLYIIVFYHYYDQYNYSRNFCHGNDTAVTRVPKCSVNIIIVLYILLEVAFFNIMCASVTFVFYLFIYLFVCLFIYSNLFPYIPLRYTPWEWKESHSLYILRRLQSDTTNSWLERVHNNDSYSLHNLTLCTEY